jgi:tetratricopeptide (TPR) repeat protein
MNKLFISILLVFITIPVLYGQTSQAAQDLVKNSQILLQKGDIDTALKEIDKAIELDPKFVSAFFVRAIIRGKKGDTAGVLADYNKIIELDPAGPFLEVIYTNRSSILLQKGEIDLALEDLNKAISLKPKAAIIYIARAVARLQKGEMQGALADYEKSIELSPTFYAAFLGRGSFRFRDGDFDGALTDYNKAIELNSKQADLYVNRGIVRGMKKDFSGAIEDIKMGAELSPKSISDETRGNFLSPFQELNQFVSDHPDNAQGYIVRGILRKFQGKEKEAKIDFEKGEKIAPELKREIKSILSKPETKIKSE